LPSYRVNSGEAVQKRHDVGRAINPADPQLRKSWILQVEVDDSRITPLIQGVSERRVPQDNAPFAPCQDGWQVCLGELDALGVDQRLLARSHDCRATGLVRADNFRFAGNQHHPDGSRSIANGEASAKIADYQVADRNVEGTARLVGDVKLSLTALETRLAM
jgi:hypothetical protein